MTKRRREIIEKLCRFGWQNAAGLGTTDGFMQKMVADGLVFTKHSAIRRSDAIEYGATSSGRALAASPLRLAA